MIREASAMTVRKNLGDLLNGVAYRHDSVIIQKSGKSVAAIVDIKLFKKIQLMGDAFEALCNQLAISGSMVDENAFQSDLKEAVLAARSHA